LISRVRQRAGSTITEEKIPRDRAVACQNYGGKKRPRLRSQLHGTGALPSDLHRKSSLHISIRIILPQAVNPGAGYKFIKDPNVAMSGSRVAWPCRCYLQPASLHSSISMSPGCSFLDKRYAVLFGCNHENSIHKYIQKF
jgi:hypothetical protein